jgi:uncharacterized membrane protein YGL010W
VPRRIRYLIKHCSIAVQVVGLGVRAGPLCWLVHADSPGHSRRLKSWPALVDGFLQALATAPLFVV